MTREPAITFVSDLDDLMTLEDYEVADQHKLVRFRLTVTDKGLEIVGDSPYPRQIDELLAALEPETIEMVLCG